MLSGERVGRQACSRGPKQVSHISFSFLTITHTASIKKAKAQLAGKADGLARETEKEWVELQNKEKNARTQEDGHLFSFLTLSCKHQILELATLVQRSKDGLERELDRTAVRWRNSNANMKCEYLNSGFN